MNVSQKLIQGHMEGDLMPPGEEIAIRIDQTLTQDATGTLVMLEFESMGIERVKTELSAQYIDHNLIQEDYKNPDDHRFLLDACRKFGLWYSPPGTGVSHPLHMERFGKPGKTLLGSDSHTPAAGAMGMLAIGAGGLEVAFALAGERYKMPMPEIMGIELTGSLPDWVSAKDVVLELLRRHDVDGAVGRILEFYGPGLASLSAMDRHVIANMGTELGATSTVFPSDERTREFLWSQQREDDWEELVADEDASYDHDEKINLSDLEPMIARPSSPGNVVKVSEVEGEEIYQAYIGSSANPGFADFAVAAEIVSGQRIPPQVSFDVNPTSRQILENLAAQGHLGKLIRAGARIHQAGCNGCIGMGQAPASGQNSLRTTPRNFPGRSGTREDRVFLCSPETAAASALKGKITDPRTLDMDYPGRSEPESILINTEMLVPPAEESESHEIEISRGPNIKPLPDFDPIPDTIEGPVLLKVGDDISTDEILPGGSQVLPYRSNIEAISRFCFRQVDESFHNRAKDLEGSDFLIVGGKNYGQGSSREHAALAPRYLGLRVVMAVSFARIHRQNLINFGILPVVLNDKDDLEAVDQSDVVKIENIHDTLESGESSIRIRIGKEGSGIEGKMQLSKLEREILQAGGMINWARNKKAERDE
jgi:aconitate hydratase